MAARNDMPLRNLTREALEPLWFRHEVSLERIAASLGVSRQGLAWKARALGLPPRGKNREPQKKSPDELFTRMWLAGVSCQELARHFGYAGGQAVSTRARKLGLPPRQKVAARTKGARGGWPPTITVVQFYEEELAQRMQTAAGKRAA